MIRTVVRAPVVAVVWLLVPAVAACATGSGVTAVEATTAASSIPTTTVTATTTAASSIPTTTAATTAASSIPTTTVTATTTAASSIPTTTVTATSAPPELVVGDDGEPPNGQTRGAVVHPDGWVLPVLGAEGTGWRVWTPCARQGHVDRGRFLGTVEVVVDPGHGGDTEPGAVGPSGLREADVNLDVASRVVTALERRGVTALATRTGDVRLPLVTRAEIALALDPAANVSIHFNAGIDAAHDGPGTETYHQIADPRSRRLAGLIQQHLTDALARVDGVRWVGMSDAGAMVRPNREGGDYYGVLRRPAGVPSVLVEVGYLTNPDEEALYADPAGRQRVADALADALVTYLTDPTATGAGFTDDPIFRGYGPSGAGGLAGCGDPEL